MEAFEFVFDESFVATKGDKPIFFSSAYNRFCVKHGWGINQNINRPDLKVQETIPTTVALPSMKKNTSKSVFNGNANVRNAGVIKK